MKDPAYSFTIPSLHDDIQLDCRLYHPKGIGDVLQSGHAVKGVIIAHPYAPLGGCFDDPVVLQLAELFHGLGFVVTTFNFRGAGDSAGRTSWTGRPEVDDFASIIGLSTYYLDGLQAVRGPDTLSPVVSISQPGFDPDSPFDETTNTDRSVDLLLAGYSFGSLILSRLPSVAKIIERFETAERGTAASEIFLRARMLAKQTRSSLSEIQSPQTPRGRKLHPEDSPTKAGAPRGSPIVVGGEETDAADRRRSRDSRRSVDVAREIPHNIKSHLRKHSGHFSPSPSGQHHHAPAASTAEAKSQPVSGPTVTVRYLLISPVLLPLTTTLLSPGLPFTSGSGETSSSGVLSLNCPTLVAFGSSDTFTSSKKLRQWAEKLAQESRENVRWREIEGAGHFWREKGSMKALQAGVREWVKET